METLRCPTCFAILGDAAAKRCPACHAKLRKRSGPIVLGEDSRISATPFDRVLQARAYESEAELRRPWQSRQLPVRLHADVEAAPVVTTPEPPPAPAPEPRSGVVIDLVRAEAAEARSDPDVDRPVVDGPADATEPPRPQAAPSGGSVHDIFEELHRKARADDSN